MAKLRKKIKSSLDVAAKMARETEGFRCRCQVDAERGRIQAESNNLEAAPTPTPIISKILLYSIVEYLAEEKNRTPTPII